MPRIHNLLRVYTAMRRLIKRLMRPLSNRWGLYRDEMGYRVFAADRMPINSENLHDHGNCWLAIPREALEANVVQSP